MSFPRTSRLQILCKKNFKAQLKTLLHGPLTFVRTILYNALLNIIGGKGTIQIAIITIISITIIIIIRSIIHFYLCIYLFIHLFISSISRR